MSVSSDSNGLQHLTTYKVTKNSPIHVHFPNVGEEEFKVVGVTSLRQRKDRARLFQGALEDGLQGQQAFRT